jgi:hypothetical protein
MKQAPRRPTTEKLYKFDRRQARSVLSRPLSLPCSLSINTLLPSLSATTAYRTHPHRDLFECIPQRCQIFTTILARARPRLKRNMLAPLSLGTTTRMKLKCGRRPLPMTIMRIPNLRRSLHSLLRPPSASTILTGPLLPISSMRTIPPWLRLLPTITIRVTVQLRLLQLNMIRCTDGSQMRLLLSSTAILPTFLTTTPI